MTEMFSPNSVKRNPTDLKLVKEVSLQEISDWLMELLEGIPENIAARVRNLETLKIGLSPIFEEMQDGDSLWLAQSGKIAPLYGHRGVALVHDSIPVVYIRFIVY